MSVRLYPTSIAHTSPLSLKSSCSVVLPWQVEHVTLAESVPVNYLRCSDVDHNSCFQLLPAWRYTCDKQSLSSMSIAARSFWTLWAGA